jgi:hypothetical protein
MQLNCVIPLLSLIYPMLYLLSLIYAHSCYLQHKPGWAQDQDWDEDYRNKY